MSPVTYIQEIRRLLDCAESTQGPAIGIAADMIADALAAGHMWHVFGTGHGHMLAEEVFYRAGGLMAVNAILDSALMLHDGALASTQVERLAGYAAIVLSKHNLEAGDVMLIASNSGRNAVPIEAAIEAKGRGLQVIALTSLSHSRSVVSRHHSGKKLFELADIVLDNCGRPGDAALEVEGLPGPLCATSTVMGVTLLQWLVYEVVGRLLARGVAPAVTISANVPGGDAHNESGFAHCRARARSL
jgi:uncharacterized phosphosugar-binding protein